MILDNTFIRNLAARGTRVDKRGFEDYRKIVVEKNPVEKAEGSARVRIGNTEVIAGVKFGVGEPFSDRPGEGVLIVNAEFSPVASPEFEAGPPSQEAIELARVVDRGIRESKTIETEKLCIEKGKKVWIVNVDIHVLNHSGNLIDAASLASVSALLNSVMPEYKKEVLNYGKRVKKLLMKCKPVSVTLAKVGEVFMMDPTLEEEGAMGARLTVTSKDDGNICAIQKGGSESLDLSEIEGAFSIAVSKAKDIRKTYL